LSLGRALEGAGEPVTYLRREGCERIGSHGDPRAYRVGTFGSGAPTTLPLMDAFRNRFTAALAAAAIALTVAACGEDDADRLRDEAESTADEFREEAESTADEIREEAETTADELREESDELRKEIEESDSPQELRREIEELEDKARGESEDIQREAEELRRELEEHVP
jgi:hypothetical protein